MENQNNKIFAFISYNHKDVKWAKWLRRKLEWYRLPAEIHNEIEDSRYIRPVFRDRDELDSGLLKEELRTRLEHSKFLIVICSPNSAQSKWVSNEVQAFIDMGRLEYIIPFIVDGEPQYYSDAETAKHPLLGECFPYALRVWNTKKSKDSLLGIAVTDDGEKDKQKAFIRVVSRMLGVSFDTLWERHKREIRTILSITTLVGFLILIFSYWFMIPIKLNIKVIDEHCNLPGMENGTLYVDGKEYSITHPDTTIVIGSLPGYYRGKEVDVSFHANRYYKVEKTTIPISMGLSQTNRLLLHRDSTFATFAGHVYCETNKDKYEPVSGIDVSVGGKKCETDTNGFFYVCFDLKEQTLTKHMILEKEGYRTIEREDEIPSKDLKYIIHYSNTIK